MTDPFEALREPAMPIDPDPDFARRLRQRLTRDVFTQQEEPCPSSRLPSRRPQPASAPARARAAARSHPVHRRVGRPPRGGLVRRGPRRRAPRRVPRQRGRHHRPRRGEPRRRGADALRGLRPVARRSRPGAAGPHHVQPHPPSGGRGRRRDDRTGSPQRRHGGARAGRPALRAWPVIVDPFGTGGCCCGRRRLRPPRCDRATSRT